MQKTLNGKNSLMQLYKDPIKKEWRLYLYAAEVVDIIFIPHLEELTEKQAIADGFKNKKQAINLLLKANYGYKRENIAILTRFKPRLLAYERRKSLIFTYLLKDLLLRKKKQTIRMKNLPKYIIGELINICWRYRSYQTAIYGFSDIKGVLSYASAFLKKNKGVITV